MMGLPSTEGVIDKARAKDAWSTYSENTSLTDCVDTLTAFDAGSEVDMEGGV